MTVSDMQPFFAIAVSKGKALGAHRKKREGRNKDEESNLIHFTSGGSCHAGSPYAHGRGRAQVSCSGCCCSYFFLLLLLLLLLLVLKLLLLLLLLALNTFSLLLFRHYFGTTSHSNVGEYELTTMEETTPQFAKRSSNASSSSALLSYDFDAFGSRLSLRLAKNDRLITSRSSLVKRVGRNEFAPLLGSQAEAANRENCHYLVFNI